VLRNGNSFCSTCYTIVLLLNDIIWYGNHVTVTYSLSSPPICVALSLVFRVMFCRSLFVLLPFFFWPLYCLSFFDLRFWLLQAFLVCFTSRKRDSTILYCTKYICSNYSILCFLFCLQFCCGIAITVANITSRSVQICWQEPCPPNGNITDYVVNVYLSDGTQRNTTDYTLLLEINLFKLQYFVFFVLFVILLRNR
jgi:hypothetical protein